MKKPKLEPIKIRSAEGMRNTVAEYCRLLVTRTAAQAVLDKEVIDVQAKHAGTLAGLDADIVRHEQAVAVYCDMHRTECFPEKRKSVDLPSAVVGFRINPPSLQKAKGLSKVTESDLAVRLASVEIIEKVDGVEKIVFTGETYVRFGKPALDKERILADRDIIPAEAFQAAGLVVSQEEEFFITPKAETAKELAA